MRKKDERFRIIAEILTAPAVAVLFWIMIFLIVLLTLSRDGFGQTNIFEMFGAVGQVGFAGAVFWLGYQQFQFSKETAERQFRIDTYEAKKDLLAGFLQLFDMTEKRASFGPEIDDSLVESWYAVADEASRIFSEEAADPIAKLADKICLLQPDTEYWRYIREGGATLDQQRESLKKNWEEIVSLKFAAWTHMHQEIILVPKKNSNLSPTSQTYIL